MSETPSLAAKAFSWRPVIAGGLICGVLDINAAFLSAWLNAGMTPGRVLQSVASGLIGAAAFQGGAGVQALGLGMHFCIALTLALVFYALSRKIPFLSRHAVVSGLVFGALVYLAMNFVVLSLAAEMRSLYIPGTKPHVPKLGWSQFCIHLTCVGLAISLAVKKFR